jgi:hypothetical protein
MFVGFKREDGTFDDACLEKVKPGEPIFVLRAQDMSAPDIVRAWTAANWHRISFEKAEEAMLCAAAMEAWPDRKWPD